MSNNLVKRRDLLKELGITVKNVKYHQGQEGTGFNCTVYVNGKKFCHAHDGAYGGCYDYSVHTSNPRDVWDLQQKITEGKYLFQYDEGGTEFSVDLDSLIDEALNVFEEEKFEKGKAMFNKGILLDDDSYRQWKVSIPTLFKKHPKEAVISTLQKAYDEEVQKGSVVINKKYLASIGVKV